MVKLAQKVTGPRRFLYQIAEFEPAFYPASSEFALALETYALDFHGLICERLIADYLCDQRIGRFADPGFVDSCAVFEPAVDRTRFHPPAARAGTAPAAVLLPADQGRAATCRSSHCTRCGARSKPGCSTGASWEMLFIGEAVPPLDLGRGIAIRAAPCSAMTIMPRCCADPICSSP
ncbi:MAG: hypothetical protein WDO24_19135 [Pseudomonadota bacterium]